MSYTHAETSRQPFKHTFISTSDSTETESKRPRFTQRSSRVGFISDSIFKFLITDDTTQTYLIVNNFETNINLNHRATALQVVNNTLHWSQSGIDKLIACFGTHDINIPYNNTIPSQAAQSIAQAVSKLNNFGTSNNTQLVDVMPGIVSTVTTEIQTLLIVLT